MAAERARGTKTQSLSLRLDPKTKFILEFMARIKGQSITTVVERGIKEVADRAGLGPPWDERGNETEQTTWADFWDPSEGVRVLKLLANPHYPTTFDEDELRSFTMVHWKFFYESSTGTTPRRPFVDILWPSNEKYLQIWRDKKSEDYWAAGEAMNADLSSARVAGPDWPPKKKQSEFDPDEEIPF